MKNFYSRTLSDNEYSYKLFDGIANPFFWLFLECEYVDINFLEENINKILNDYKELQCIIKNKKILFKQKKITIENLNNDFKGYNYNSLNFLFDAKNISNQDETLIKLYFIKEKSGECNIIFRVSHILMDGKGCVYFIKALLGLMKTGSVNQITNCFISDIEFIKNISTKKESRKLSFTNKLILKSAENKNSIYVKRLTINKNDSFVLSKIISIVNKYYQNENLTYMIPTSIRKYNEKVVSVSNLTTPLYFRCNKEDDWLTISKKIYFQLKNKDNLNIKNIKFGPIINIKKSLFNLIINASQLFQQKCNRFLTAGSITNLGLVDFSEYITDKINIKGAYIIPFYQPLLPFSIAITEAVNKTEIVFITNSVFISQESAEKLLKEIDEQIK